MFQEFKESKSIVQAKSTMHARDLKNKYTIQERKCIFEDETTGGEKNNLYKQVFCFLGYIQINPIPCCL